MGGDFNAGADQIMSSQGMSPQYTETWAQVGSGSSFTAFMPTPTMKIDFWLADSGGKAKPLWSRVIASTGSLSDHLAVVTGFRIYP